MLAARTRDVCSPLFDVHAASAALRSASGDTMVADALLNQDLLPGCGNIIKNEALHTVGIDPRTLMQALSGMQVERLVQAVRTFSLAWLRSGRHPPCKVYNCSFCSDCGGSVALCKLGRDVPRPTFWCAVRVGAGTCGHRAETVQRGEKRKLGGASEASSARTDPWQIAARAAPAGGSPRRSVGRATGGQGGWTQK